MNPASPNGVILHPLVQYYNQEVDMKKLLVSRLQT